MAVEPVVMDLRQRLQSISEENEKKKFLDSFEGVQKVANGRDEHRQRSLQRKSYRVTLVSPRGARGLYSEVRSDTHHQTDGKSSPSVQKEKNIDPVMFSLTHSRDGTIWFTRRNTARYGASFFNPKRNIWTMRFWQFHKFINDKFQNWLQPNGLNYDSYDEP